MHREESEKLPHLLSRVLVLENIVDIQDADDELRDEIKMEC
jgi:splicing factor 45